MNDITMEEVLKEIERLDPKLVALAIANVRIQKLTAALAEKTAGEDEETCRELPAS